MKDLVSLADWSAETIAAVLDVAARLKAGTYSNQADQLLKGKTLAMIFEKPSTRTRISFEVAMQQLGGHSLYIAGSEIGLGVREPIEDVARVLSRYVHGIVVRNHDHQAIEALAHYASASVINGLSDVSHPCQILADALTIQEKKGRLQGIELCYIGDGNNVCYSLMILASKMGLKMRVCCPKGYEPRRVPDMTGITITHDPVAGVEGVDVVYTDVWTSMGDESDVKKRLADFSGFQVSTALLNAAKPDVLFMHCLPAHRGEEVSADVMNDSRSVVFDQAENRLHAQKGILVTLISREGT